MKRIICALVAIVFSLIFVAIHPYVRAKLFFWEKERLFNEGSDFDILKKTLNIYPTTQTEVLHMDIRKEFFDIGKDAVPYRVLESQISIPVSDVQQVFSDYASSVKHDRDEIYFRPRSDWGYTDDRFDYFISCVSAPRDELSGTTVRSRWDYFVFCHEDNGMISVYIHGSYVDWKRL